jgi:uncharacterized protein YbjT (DUF2867 family)
MILVTGGTGFIGQALIRQLVSLGKPVRTLLRPSIVTPNLPRGIPIEVAVSSFDDERSLRAAMKGVDVIYHLAGSERLGSRLADLVGVDIEGTKSIAKIAAEAEVNRIIYLSHLGADRSSAFPLLKAKAIAEGHVVNCGIDFTIVRSGVAFGPNDQFTVSLARLLKISPGLFLMPGDGSALIHPIWVEDLTACLAWIMEDSQFVQQTISIGGAEHLTFHQTVETIMQETGVRRSMVSISPAYLRIISLMVEQLYPNWPVSAFWLDYLAVNRTAPLDVLPRLFGLIPARLNHNIHYLKE